MFIPRNVDERRLGWNYYCVAAGQDAYIYPTLPNHISELPNWYICFLSIPNGRAMRTRDARSHRCFSFFLFIK